jgi:hypothetical protein
MYCGRNSEVLRRHSHNTSQATRFCSDSDAIRTGYVFHVLLCTNFRVVGVVCMGGPDLFNMAVPGESDDRGGRRRGGGSWGRWGRAPLRSRAREAVANSVIEG